MLSCLAVMALTISACDTATPRISANAQGETVYDQVGLDHNDAMAQLYAELGAMPASQRALVFADEPARDAFIASETGVFMAARGYPVLSEAEMRSTAANPFASSRASDLGSELVLAVQASSSASDAAARISLIEGKIQGASLTPADTERLLLAAAVARHSAVHWEENLDEWVELAGHTPDPSRALSCWAGVVAGDVVGAAYGANAGTAGILGHAIYGSASAAIAAAYRGCFGW